MKGVVLLVCLLSYAEPAMAYDSDKYLDCAEAASKRAGPKNCAAYKEGLSCFNKAIQAIKRETAGDPNNYDARMALKETQEGTAVLRSGAKKAGCL